MYNFLYYDAFLVYEVATLKMLVSLLVNSSNNIALYPW